MRLLEPFPWREFPTKKGSSMGSGVSEKKTERRAGAAVAIDALRSSLENRRALVPFSEILKAIQLIRGTGELSVLLGHPKLTGRPSRLTVGDFLVYNRFSFSIRERSVARLMDLPEPEQSGFMHEVHGKAQQRTDFAVVWATGSYARYAKDILQLLHLFFVTTEYDKLVAKSAKTLVHHEVIGKNDRTPRYDQLIELNASRFGLQTGFFRERPDGRISMFLGNLPDDPDGLAGVERLVRDSMRLRQSLNGEIAFSGAPAFLRTIPLRQKDRRIADGCAAILSLERPIASFAVAINEFVVDHYNDQRISGDQARTQAALQSKIIAASHAKASDSGTVQQEFLELVTQQLLATTHAHSVTIRRYNSYTDTLDLVAIGEHAEEIECAADGLVSGGSGKAALSIGCSPEASVNGFCYKRALPNEAIYIPDIDNIPEDYASRGFEAVKRCRPGTRSELYVPIQSRRLLYGTINLEAPFKAAFEFDVDYVKTVSFLTSQFLEILSSSQDSWWLSHLSFTHLATHELKDFKASLNQVQQGRLERIIYTLSPQNIYSTQEKVTLQFVMRSIEDAHRGMTAKLPFEKIWKLKGIDLGQVINGRFASSLRLILLSVLTNTKHSKYESDCIELERMDDLPHLPIMQLTYRSGTAVVDPELIRGMFISPNINSDGWHFGMFLIGVHTRLLGGTVEIDPDCCKEVGYGRFCFRISIPLETEV